MGERVEVDYPGPFSEHRVVVDGFQVPYLTAHLPPGGRVDLTLDSRFGLDLSVAEAERVVWFIAQAIAVGMGHASHGGPPRPAFTRLTEITSFEEGPADNASGAKDG